MPDPLLGGLPPPYEHVLGALTLKAPQRAQVLHQVLKVSAARCSLCRVVIYGLLDPPFWALSDVKCLSGLVPSSESDGPTNVTTAV